MPSPTDCSPILGKDKEDDRQDDDDELIDDILYPVRSQ